MSESRPTEARPTEARPSPRREELPRVNWEALDEFVQVHRVRPGPAHAQDPARSPESTEAAADPSGIVAPAPA